MQAANSIVTSGANYANTLAAQIGTVTINTAFPANNPLAAQLLMVAKLIAIRNTLGMTRQIFFCQLDGFDTHGSSSLINPGITLLQPVEPCGQRVLPRRRRNCWSNTQVTTFTASEFGRTLSLERQRRQLRPRVGRLHHFIVGFAVMAA